MSCRLPSVCLVAAVGLLIGAPAGNGQESNQVKNRKKSPAQDREADQENAGDQSDGWMKNKLRSSQRIFAGLTNGDFEAIDRNASAMNAVHILETWMRRNAYVKEYEYKGQQNAFEYATKELIRHARKKNVDGCLDAYIALSRSCVRCHSLIRDPAPRGGR